MKRARNLQATRHSRAYKQRMMEAVAFLLMHISQHGWAPLSSWKKQASLASLKLVEYIQHLYERDANKHLSLAVHTILGVQTMFRNLKGKLRAAWDSIDSWKKEVPRSLRTPMLLPILLAASITARVHACLTDGIDAYLWLSLSVLSETAFFGLLRPGEMLKLRYRMISLPQLLLSAAVDFAIVNINEAKNRRQLGASQFSVVRSTNVTAWLYWFTDGLSGDDLLWPSSDTEFRRRFNLILNLLGFQHVGYKPSSLRPGGATWFYSQNIDPPRLKFWGRWASEKSLNHYLQEAIARQLSINMSSSSHKLIDFILRSGSDFLTPPNSPWWSFAVRPGRKAHPVARVVSTHFTPSGSGVWEKLYPPP